MERFTTIDKSKGDQIEKLGKIAEKLRKENVQLKEHMKAEFAKQKQMHEEELKLQEQEAMESLAVLQSRVDNQSEEMRKFGDFIKVQSETVK